MHIQAGRRKRNLPVGDGRHGGRPADRLSGRKHRRSPGRGSPLRSLLISSLLSGGISATKGKITGGGTKQTVPVTDATDVRKVAEIDAPDVRKAVNDIDATDIKNAVKDIDAPDIKTTNIKEPVAGTQQGNIRPEIKADTQTALDIVDGDKVLKVSSIQGGESYVYSGEEWCRYFREKYGVDNVIWENATPSQLARSWQGTGQYTGVDSYTDTVVKKGTILYRAEPNGTEYFTTKSAIQNSGNNAELLFKGLQVKEHRLYGYRKQMQGYKFNEDIESAYGIVTANPQFGKGGLSQYFVPNTQEYIDKGILVPIDTIELN